MFHLPDNILPAAWAAIACLAAATGGLAACSSAPVKMECRELQMRIDYGDLSADQLRFAMEELDECKRRQRAAEVKDSTLIEGTQDRFTPAEE